MSDPLLSPPRLHRLRLEAGHSKRQLARLVGVSYPVIDRLEQGQGHGALTLRKLERLAAALAVHPAHLLQDETHPAVPGTDDLTVEAALATSPTFLRTDELARGLGWELARTHRALRQLRARLIGTGQDLRRTSNGWALSPRAELLADAQTAALERARIRRRKLNRRAADLLHQILHEQLPANFTQNLTNPDRVTLASLLKARLIEATPAGYRVTEQVALARLSPHPSGSASSAPTSRSAPPFASARLPETSGDPPAATSSSERRRPRSPRTP